MPERIQERLQRQAKKNFIGRTREIATLLEALEEEGPLVTFVHDAVRQTIEAMLRASDPSQYRAYRRLAWGQHLQEQPLPPPQNALFMRRSLAAETGEIMSGVQAACWLDVKRTYLASPHLGRIYVLTADQVAWVPIMAQLGFRSLPEMETMVEHKIYNTMILDFGPTSVIGWLAGLVDARYGSREPDCRLDVEARELILDNKQVRLTRLEFGVMHCLWQRKGRTVSRVDLLEEVWGYEYDGGGSNVVDAVVRSLRKKLDSKASAIETVTGVGYRFRGFAED